MARPGAGLLGRIAEAWHPGPWKAAVGKRHSLSQPLDRRGPRLKYGAAEYVGSCGLRDAGSQGVAQSVCPIAIAQMGTRRSDSPLKKEPALCPVKNDLTRCGSAESTGKGAIPVGNDANLAMPGRIGRETLEGG